VSWLRLVRLSIVAVHRAIDDASIRLYTHPPTHTTSSNPERPPACPPSPSRSTSYAQTCSRTSALYAIPATVRQTISLFAESHQAHDAQKQLWRQTAVPSDEGLGTCDTGYCCRNAYVDFGAGALDGCCVVVSAIYGVGGGACWGDVEWARGSLVRRHAGAGHTQKSLHANEIINVICVYEDIPLISSSLHARLQTLKP
jgi:hypothetical protein